MSELFNLLLNTAKATGVNVTNQQQGAVRERKPAISEQFVGGGYFSTLSPRMEVTPNRVIKAFCRPAPARPVCQSNLETPSNSARGDKRMRNILLVVCLLTLSITMFAADPNTTLGNASLNTTLQVTATAQTAILFQLKTSTQAKACAISAPGATTDYTMSFGTVDGLGLTNNACTNNFAVAGGQMWATNYAYVARFAGFSAVSGTKLEAALSAANPTGFALYEGPAAAVTAGAGLVPLSTSKTQIGGVISSSTTAVDRTFALLVSEGTAVPSNAYSSVVTFTLTPQ
jgi:hypothetical protein